MATAERLRVEHAQTINLERMSGSAKSVMHSCLFGALERYYADHDNVAGFEQWQSDKQKRKEMERNV